MLYAPEREHANLADQLLYVGLANMHILFASQPSSNDAPSEGVGSDSASEGVSSDSAVIVGSGHSSSAPAIDAPPSTLAASAKPQIAPSLICFMSSLLVWLRASPKAASCRADATIFIK